MVVGVRNPIRRAIVPMVLYFPLSPPMKVLVSDPPLAGSSNDEVRFSIPSLPEKGLWQATVELSMPRESAPPLPFVILAVVRGINETRIATAQVVLPKEVILPDKKPERSVKP